MKKTLVLLILVLSAVSIFAQAPQAFKYQAVIRDASDNLIANQAVTVRITIANSSPSDVYVETHNVTTSLFGLINLNIGEGTVTLGVFNTIDWAGDTYSVGVEVDAGSGYEDLGSSDLLSVPYALYALSSGGGGSSNWTVTGTDIYNNNSGNVGIGTTTPTGTLTIGGGDIDALYFENGTNDAYMGTTGFDFQITSSDDIILSLNTGDSNGYFEIEDDFNSTVLFRLNNDGKAGFGTISPLTDITIQQDTFALYSIPGEAGITLYAHFAPTSDQWTIYNSYDYLSFAFENVRLAYINSTTGAWTTTSDRRFKENIAPMTPVLNKILQLEPVSYDFIGRENSHTIGFIAQDVLPLFPEVVSKDDESEESYYGIAYGSMSIIAIKAIQEQQLIIENQANEIQELKTGNLEQQRINEDLLRRIEALEEK